MTDSVETLRELLAPLDRADAFQPLALCALVLVALSDVGLDEGGTFGAVAAQYREFVMAAVTAEGRNPELPEEHLSPEEVRHQLREQVLPALARLGLIALPPAGLATADAHLRLAAPLWRAAQDDAETLLVMLGAPEGGSTRGFPPPQPIEVTGGSQLSAEGLVKMYRGRKVVNDVALQLRQGEIVGLLGPNGAGKTTTFYMIVGLIAPMRGRIRFDGDDITQTPMYKRARRGIGYLAQEPSIFRKLTVEENILAILETLGLSSKERQARLEHLLDELKIKHLRKSKAFQLSGGERRRLEITRALVTEPKFMMLDEPFAGVDPKAVYDIQKIVAQLRYRGIGVLISDHNVEQTLEIVDRAYIMYEGQVRVAGTVRELVFDDTVSEFYLGPTLTARLRARYAGSTEEASAR